MPIQSCVFKQFYYPTSKSVAVDSKKDESCELVDSFVRTFVLPDEKTNYSRFDDRLATQIASYKELALNPVLSMLSKKDDEKSVTAGLYLINRIVDAGAKNVADYYPVIARFNDSKSDNVRVMLAGVYRKTQVPDAFGPLMSMYMDDCGENKNKYFDSREEVGGAILSYLQNKELGENLINYLKNQASINNYQKK